LISSEFTSEKEFWTGGFRHELNGQWSWCTKDSPEPIPSTMLTGGVIVESTSTEAGAKQRRTKEDDYNCVSVTYEATGDMFARSCNATNIYLSCESVEKYPSELLVRFLQCAAMQNKLVFIHSLIKDAEQIVALKRAKEMLVLSENFLRIGLIDQTPFL
jgi:hypothetical protein